MVAINLSDTNVEYVTVSVGDPTDEAQVIAAIRAAVPSGLAKAKQIGTGTDDSPDYAWELSAADDLTRLYEPQATGSGTDLALGTRTTTTMQVLSSTGDPVDLLAASTTEAGLVTSTQYDLIESIPGISGNTDLGIANRTATTLDVTSSTGNSATIPAASTTEAGLMTDAQFDLVALIPGLPTADTSITTGTLLAATGVRVVDMGSNNLNFTNVSTINADGPVASTASFQAPDLIISANSNTVTHTAPANLANTFDLTWFGSLPTAGDVSNGANYVRVDATGNILLDSTPADINTNITTGLIGTAVDNRTIDFGANALNMQNTSQMTFASAGPITLSTTTVDATSASVQAASVAYTGGGQAVTVTPPTPATGSYGVEWMDSLPSAQQVTDSENFVRIDSTGKLYQTSVPGGGPVPGTNLSLINRTATTMDVASDTGTDATLLPASTTQAGLLTATQFDLVESIVDLPTSDTSITSGTLPVANGNRTADFGSYNVVWSNASTFQITANSFSFQNGTGTTISTSSGDVTIAAEGDIFLTSSIVDARTAAVRVASINYDTGTQLVNVSAPPALAAGYNLVWFDQLPDTADVSGNANYVRLLNDGTLYYGATPDGGGGTPTGDISETVATKADRTSAPLLVGWTSFVNSNRTLYRWDGFSYSIEAAEVTGTATDRAALTEVEDNAIFNDVSDRKIYRYLGTITPPWIQLA